MTSYLLDLQAFSSELRADLDRATYFVIEAVDRKSDGTELLLLQEAFSPSERRLVEGF